MLIETNNLVRISTFAKNYRKKNGDKGCTQDYIRKMKNINIIYIDTAQFIDQTAPYNVEGKKQTNKK